MDDARDAVMNAAVKHDMDAPSQQSQTAPPVRLAHGAVAFPRSASSTEASA